VVEEIASGEKKDFDLLLLHLQGKKAETSERSTFIDSILRLAAVLPKKIQAIILCLLGNFIN